jgi:hypothetical protein
MATQSLIMDVEKNVIMTKSIVDRAILLLDHECKKEGNGRCLKENEGVYGTLAVNLLVLARRCDTLVEQIDAARGR